MNHYIDLKTIEAITLKDETLADYHFNDCHFKSCYFENIKLERCQFYGCTFENVTVISPLSQYSEANHLNIINSNFLSVAWGLFYNPQKHQRLFNQIKSSFFKYNTFIDMNLSKIDFSNNQFHAALFESCNLKESRFINCDLEDSEWLHCNLEKSNFKNASNFIISPTLNKIQGAQFSLVSALSLLEQLGIIIED